MGMWGLQMLAKWKLLITASYLSETGIRLLSAIFQQRIFFLFLTYF